MKRRALIVTAVVAALTAVQDTHYGDATAFETDPATVVAIDRQPFTG